jgi:hypothetical protein
MRAGAVLGRGLSEGTAGLSHYIGKTRPDRCADECAAIRFTQGNSNEKASYKRGSHHNCGVAKYCYETGWHALRRNKASDDKIKDAGTIPKRTVATKTSARFMRYDAPVQRRTGFSLSVCRPSCWASPMRIPSGLRM